RFVSVRDCPIGYCLRMNVEHVDRTIGIPIPVRLTRAVPRVRLATPIASNKPRISLVEIWHDALATFCAHCGPILVCTLLSLTLSLLVAGVAPAFAAGSRLWMLVQVGVVVLIQSLARGAVACMALHGPGS